MAAKLDIEFIEIKNFLSYGDYVTRLEVANLGPVLVLGEIDSNDGFPSSNGAGKSSLLAAFIWCLFGRTITNPNPGDKIVNWFTKKNCYVKIKTANGWEIIRTRNFDGHSELILRKDGDDETQSTNTNAQNKLKELFGLNYEIFTSSVFCGQFGKSFLEMPPAKRKETIEKLLGLDRINNFADEAKAQFKQIETRQEITRSKIEVLESDDKRQLNRLDEAIEQKGFFEEDRNCRLAKLNEILTETSDKIAEINLSGVSKIKQQWAIATAILNKIAEYEKIIQENQVKITLYSDELSRLSLNPPSLYDLPDFKLLEKDHENYQEAINQIKKISDVLVTVKSQVRCSEADVSRIEKKIKDWEDKIDTKCDSCEQNIDQDHVEKSIEDFKKELSRIIRIRDNHRNAVSRLQKGKSDLETIKKPAMSLQEAKRIEAFNQNAQKDYQKALARYDSIKNFQKEAEDYIIKTKKLIDSTLQKFEEIKPEISLDEINKLETIHNAYVQRISDLKDQINNVSKEVNPWIKISNDLIEVSKELKSEIEELNNENKQLDVLFKHYKYIYRSYSDRRKIKSWLLSELIPFLNDRVQYYLDTLDININVKFSSTLNAETDRWDYEFCSGGERKRIDLAIMFGLYDLYVSIYGQQCNIMVLDEVDSRLDKQGVEAFSEIVHDICTNDDRPRPSTIFVISHKQELKSLISSQVIIKKENHHSKIDQTVFND